MEAALRAATAVVLLMGVTRSARDCPSWQVAKKAVRGWGTFTSNENGCSYLPTAEGSINHRPPSPREAPNSKYQLPDRIKLRRRPATAQLTRAAFFGRERKVLLHRHVFLVISARAGQPLPS